jgi:hypothetical protein
MRLIMLDVPDRIARDTESIGKGLIGLTIPNAIAYGLNVFYAQLSHRSPPSWLFLRRPFSVANTRAMPARITVVFHRPAA